MNVKLVIFLLPLIAMAALATTQRPVNASFKKQPIANSDKVDVSPINLGNQLIANVLRPVARFFLTAIANILTGKWFPELADYTRLVWRFLRSILTHDNFYLLRRTLLYISRVSDFMSSYMPKRPQTPGLMQSLFPSAASSAKVKARVPVVAPSKLLESVDPRNPFFASNSPARIKLAGRYWDVLSQLTPILGSSSDEKTEKPVPIDIPLAEKYLKELDALRSKLEQQG